MDDNILFSVDEVENLNKKVEKNIASHLFLFCNYDPSFIEVTSTDAKFIKAVLNFYMLLNDSGAFNIVRDVKNAGEINFDSNFKQLKKFNTQVRNLRAALTHNATNVGGDSAERKQYKNWLKNQIGKEYFEKEEDYRIALNSLINNADMTKDILVQFIGNVSHSKNKEMLISYWEDSIISFLTKFTSKNIFQYQVYETYISLHVPNLNNIPTQSQLYNEAGLWIREAYFFHEEIQRIELCDRELKKHVSRDLKNKLQAKKKEAEEKEKNKKEKIAQGVGHKEEELDKKPGLYIDFYFSLLKEKIKQALKIIRGSDITMMPHDIIPFILETDLTDESGWIL